MNKILSSLPINEMYAVVQLGFQLIASANGGFTTEKDDPSIDYIIEEIGFGKNPFAGTAIWNEASDADKVNPFSAFATVARFSREKKEAFRSMIESLCSPDLLGYTTIRLLRIDIARQIYERIGF